MSPARRLRITFVLPELAAGGAERVALTLLAGLDRQRYRPTLILLQDGGALRRNVPEDVPVCALGRPRLRAALAPLLAALRRADADVLFSTLGYVNLAVLALARLLPRRPRVVIREANMPSASLERQKLAVAIRIGYRLLYPSADRVIASSQAMAGELSENFAIAPARIHVLANPIDTDSLRQAALPLARVPGTGPRFVACGRLTHQKGFDRLLSMLAAMPGEWHTTILGEGPDRASLQQQAAALGIAQRVDIAGFAAEPWRWFAGADALLLPSRWEGQSNVALEALACGCPVLATPEAGGIEELALQAPGAIGIAAAGEPFIAAMRRVAPAFVDCPRPSLLPASHEAATVLHDFQRLLDG